MRKGIQAAKSSRARPRIKAAISISSSRRSGETERWRTKTMKRVTTARYPPTSDGRSQERRRVTGGRCGASAGCTGTAYSRPRQRPSLDRPEKRVRRWDFAKTAVILRLAMLETAPEASPSRSPRVLVVDDERSIVDFIRLGLQYEGFQVQTAPDGQGALRMIREVRPHGVVRDIRMP